MTNQKVNTRYSPEARDIYFTVPNLISALRIISIPFISVLISKHEMIAALALIAISSASDGLDGIIARRFNQVSKIGQILDPIADRLLIFCSILALSVAGIIPWWMLIIVGLRDLWMAIQVLWLAQYGYGPLPVHFVGKAGTALLMISIVSLIFADLGTNTFFHLLYIAALAGIDPQLHESAYIDGANRFQCMWHINLPGIMPTIVILLILNSGHVLSVGFEKVYLMQNDLNVTTAEVISTYVYKIGLKQQQYSYSAAIGLFNNLINFILLVVVNKLSKKLSGSSLW